jgi:WD40 repeat protein
VIDALDECDNDDDIMLILRLLAEDQTNGCVQLRFFLTSRPEIPVRRVFDKLPEIRRRRFVLHEIVADTTNDLSIFFNKKLAEVAENHDLGLDWPGSIRIQKLVDHANGLFVWAATACRFIDDGKQFANDRLSTILEGRRGTSEPQDRLDKIYTTVFTHSIYTTYSEEEISTAYGLLRYILGSIVVLFSQLPVDSVAELLGLEGLVVKRTLTDLHSILFIPDNANEPLRLHHPSLRDFLLNTKRCTTPDLYIDKKKAHRMILITCIRLMSTTLKKDICGLRAPGSLVKDVSSHRVEQCLPPGLQYSCLYWGQHLVKSCTDIYDNDFIHRFMEQHLLHWLEALSLMGRVSEGILVINLLISRTVVCAVIEDIDRLELISCQASECPNFCNFIQDAKRFVLYNRVCFQEAPLQVYFSGLIFAPGQSIIKKQFKEQALEWIKQIPKARVRWSPCLQTLEGHNAPVTSVAFRPDNKMLASASGDKTIRLWDPTTGQCLQTLEGHNTWVHSVVFRPDNKILASASRDMTIRLWDSTTGYCLQILKGHNESVESVAFRPDGKILASASGDKTIRLWHSTTGQCLQILEGHEYWVGSIAFQPDGEMLASASDDEIIRLWNPTTGKCLQTLEGHNTWVHSVAFRPDGKMLASASNDETVRLWDPTTGQCLQTLEDQNESVQTMEGHNGLVTFVAFRPDGKMLASTSGDMTIRLWDSITGQCLHTLKGHHKWVQSVAFQADGRILASASGDKTIRLWNSATGVCLQILKGHNESVESVAFRLDGKMLASASDDMTVRLWDPITGQCLHTLKGHNQRVKSVAFRADGKMLASVSNDDTIYLWDSITGQCLQTFKGHNQQVRSVAFRADGKMLASMSDNDTICLWDCTTGQHLQTLERHYNWVPSFEYSHSVRTLTFLDHYPYLNTNRGIVRVDSIRGNLQSDRQPAYELYLTTSWITLRTRNFLWIPSEYRQPSSSGVHNNMVALGYPSGQVIILIF